MNPCVRIIFKSKQLIIWAIIRSTTLLTSLLCGSWALPCPSHSFAGDRYFLLANSFESLIQVCRPQCRVTINCKFFTMASIEGMYQLLIVSYVPASCRDLVTTIETRRIFWVHSLSMKGQGSWPDPGDRPPLIDWRRLSWLMTSWEGQSNSQSNC